MLISYKKKFIYIQVWKTGSTSLMEALRPYSYRFRAHELIMRMLFKKFQVDDLPKWSLHFNTHKHSKASGILKLMGRETFKDFFSFCFVRNPFDWLVSLYGYILSTPEHRHYELVRYLNSFEDYVHWRTESGNRVLQKSWVCDAEGKQLIDFVGKFETLKNDLEIVGQKVGIDITMPHLNKTANRRRDFREYYTSQELVDFVVDQYKEDFEYFNYRQSL